MFGKYSFPILRILPVVNDHRGMQEGAGGWGELSGNAEMLRAGQSPVILSHLYSGLQDLHSPLPVPSGFWMGHHKQQLNLKVPSAISCNFLA